MSVGTLARDLHPPAGADASSARALLGSPVALAVISLSALAAVLRFTGLGHQGFWFDEANTVLEIHLSPGKMITLLKHYESTPPLYYSVAWVWARLFGYGEAGLRALSALCGVLTVPVAYAAGAKLASRRAGLIVAALTACNPLLIWYSQEARAYSLVVLLTGATVLAFAYARSDPTPRALAAWTIASGLALSTEYYALLVVVPEALWLLYLHRRRRSVQVGIVALAVWSAPLVWFAISQNATGHASWISPIPLGPRLGQLIPQFLTGLQAPAQTVTKRVAEVAAIFALVLLAVRSDPRERKAILVVATIAVGGLLLNLLLIAGGIDDLITRNVLSLWFPAALVIAGGLGVRRAGAAGIVAAVVLCAIGLVGAVGVKADRNLQRPDWRGVARVVGARPAPGVGQRAILVQHYQTLLPLSLYLPDLKFWPGRRPFAVRELDVVSISAPRVPLCWWGSACNLSPSRMQSAYPIAGFHELWVRRAYQFTIMRLVAPSPRVITPAIVSAVLRTTHLRRDELLIQR